MAFVVIHGILRCAQNDKTMDLLHRDILKGVSRSFYLSLVCSPRAVRDTLGYAFLLCKIADTIADTELIPRDERLEVLQRYRELFVILSAAKNPVDHLQDEILPLRQAQGQDDSTAESKLLRATSSILAALKQLPQDDQRHIAWLVPELTQGMITDLTFFSPHEGIQTLPDEAALDRYTYHVAGCVGRFWTRVLTSHYPFAAAWKPEMEEIGERFGKGLQMVNILRDLPRDLQKGRRYLPSNHFDLYFQKTRELLSEGKAYVAQIPRRYVRLRSAVIVPMQLGFQTLDLLERSPQWLDANSVVKVSRRQVYMTVISSFLPFVRGGQVG